jgi:hypothetical protein
MSSGGMHPHPEALYYFIAYDAVQSAKVEGDEFRRKQLITTALVFCALCLETFINQEYVAHDETAKIIEDDEHLSLESKWLMLPLLLGASHTFDKRRKPYQSFRSLVITRNQRLVHFKPLKETRRTGGTSRREYFGDLVNNLALAEQYLNSLGDMIYELRRLTKGKTSEPSFLKGDRYLSRVWTDITIPIDNA